MPRSINTVPHSNMVWNPDIKFMNYVTSDQIYQHMLLFLQKFLDECFEVLQGDYIGVYSSALPWGPAFYTSSPSYDTYVFNGYGELSNVRLSIKLLTLPLHCKIIMN